MVEEMVIEASGIEDIDLLIVYLQLVPGDHIE